MTELDDLVDEVVHLAERAGDAVPPELQRAIDRLRALKRERGGFDLCDCQGLDFVVDLPDASAVEDLAP